MSRLIDLYNSSPFKDKADSFFQQTKDKFLNNNQNTAFSSFEKTNMNTKKDVQIPTETTTTQPKNNTKIYLILGAVAVVLLFMFKRKK
jgi:hypothetical protein